MQALRAIAYNAQQHSMLATAGDDGRVTLWDTNAARVYHEFGGTHKAPCTAVAWSPFNSVMLASAGLDMHLQFYDWRQRRAIKTLWGTEPFTALAFAPGDQRSVAGGTQSGARPNEWGARM